MSKTDFPNLNGCRRIATHVCPRCGDPVRVLYAYKSTEVSRDGATAPEGYAEAPFATGTLLISSDHTDEQWGAMYAGSSRCGYMLPTLMPSSEAWINQIYERLDSRFYSYNPTYTFYADTRRTPRERIVSFDVARFLAMPWLLRVPALEAGQPDLIMLPDPTNLRVALAHGAVPPLGIPAAEISTAQMENTPALFLAAIGAVTEPRPF
jgi:hypothetical protein